MSNNRLPVAGSVLVASGAIGAGMFALPIVSAGMWTSRALGLLTIVWLANLIATLMLAKANLRYPPGSSFSTVVRNELGEKWKRANNIAIWFVMSILLYAYFSASSSVVAHTLLQMKVHPWLTDSQSSLGFGCLVALLVWYGSSLVSKVCGVLLIGMVISFAYSTGGLLLNLNTSNLLLTPTTASNYIFAALPYYVTAFACAGLVPSLVKHYHGKSRPILTSLLYGTIFTLIIYALWVSANFGNLKPEDFSQVIEAGGNIGNLASALQTSVSSVDLLLMLTIFSNLAVTTSFLSIGLGLFDFIADSFGHGNSALERLKTTFICFALPATLSYLFPNGFVLAIGYAGIAVLFSFYLIPALMAWRLDDKGSEQYLHSRVCIFFVIAFAAIVLICKILSLLDLLPSFP